MTYSIHDIKSMLLADIEGVAQTLAPRGKKMGGWYKAPNPTRAGEKSATSFSIKVSGDKIGSWNEFDSGEKGDVFMLIGYVYNLDHRNPKDMVQILAWAKNYLGLSHDKPTALQVKQKKQELTAQQAARNKDEEKDRLKRRDRAREIYFNAKPKGDVAWVLVETYFLNRGINYRKIEYPEDDLRIAPRLRHWASDEKRSVPAIVAPIRQANGEYHGVHCTFLEPNGASKLKVSMPKLMLGEKKGGVVRLSKGATGLTIEELAEQGLQDKVVLCEGLETGLSLAFALPEARVFACLDLGNIGNFSLFDYPMINGIIVAIDKDTKEHAIKQREVVLEVLRQQCELCNASFAVLQPQLGDFNDDLRA
jgi:hypothetical protein